MAVTERADGTAERQGQGSTLAPGAADRWVTAAGRAVRTLGAVSLAGAIAGLVVGGVGGRLAMMLLARLNPRATGLMSDDGFIMGRLTSSGTLNLLAVGFGLGVLGAAVYAVLRGLMIGPRWFQVLSISAGPAVVVGEMLVHTDGVDFTLLQPAWAAIALFVAIPGLYAVALTLLAERWLAPGGLFERLPARRAAWGLLVWAVAFPLLPLLAALALGWSALWWAREGLRRSGAGGTALAGHAPVWGAWLARAALTALFAWSSLRLASETAQLT